MPTESVTETQAPQETSGAPDSVQEGAAESESTAPEETQPDASSSEEGGGTLLDTGGETGSPEGESADDDDVGLHDWREEYSGGDEKLKKVISRYRSPKDVAKALADAKNFIRSNKAVVPEPGDDATPEEIAEYRKSMNIPESAEEYEVSWGEGGEPTETDKAILDTFASEMHKANATPKQLQAAVDWYNDQLKAVNQDRMEHRYNTQVETQSELKAEWGGEYRANLNAIKQFIVGQMGGDEDAATNLFRTQLEDGSLLGDHLPFIKLLATPAVDYVGPNAIFSGDTKQTQLNLEQRKNELLEFRRTDPEKYKSDAIQTELQGIYEKLEKLEERE